MTTRNNQSTGSAAPPTPTFSCPSKSRTLPPAAFTLVNECWFHQRSWRDEQHAFSQTRAWIFINMHQLYAIEPIEPTQWDPTFSCSETHIAKNPSRPGYEPKIKMGQEVTILNAPKHHGIHSMTGEFWAGVTSPQELQPFINRPKSSMVLSGFMANGQEFYSFSHVKAWFLEDHST